MISKNPLSEFVVLPAKYQKSLWYSNVMPGIIRGALAMVNIKSNCYFRQDTLHGDAITELRLELLDMATDKYAEDSD